MIRNLLLPNMVVLCQHILAQNWTSTEKIWKKIEQKQIGKEKETKHNINVKIGLFHLNKKELNVVPQIAQSYYSNCALSGKKTHEITILQVPKPDGAWRSFHLVESPVMHPDLAKKFPQLQSYKRVELNNPATSIYFGHITAWVSCYDT